MLRALRPAILVSVIFLVLLGLAYPLAETGIGQAFFSHQANGSLTTNGAQAPLAHVLSTSGIQR
jgi:K+-transporting ATPase ATPase C chain